MIWIVGGCLAFGVVFLWIGGLLDNRTNPNERSAAPLYWLSGLTLIAVAIVLAIGNAAVRALL